VRRLLNIRLASEESGLTLIELLVASAMSVVLLGAIGAMVVSAVRAQPDISERSQNVSTARWVLERLTREIRNGVSIEDGATASRVSFVTKVRRTACGGSGTLPAEEPARECQVTYDCSTGTCTRAEAEKGDLEGGTPTVFVSGLESGEVFNFSPSVEAATYIGVTLRVPNPSGAGKLTIADGASLRTPTLPVP
jgi:hypothetical protein